MAEVVELKRPAKFSGLDEPSAIAYYRAISLIDPFLKEIVISPFEGALKAYTGFTGRKKPPAGGPVKTVYESGDITFTVTSKRTTKRPEYKDVYERMVEYADSLVAGKERKGVEAVKDAVYVTAKTFVEIVNSWKTEVVGEGVEHKIAFTAPPELSKERPDTFVVKVADYSKLEGDHGLVYVKASILRDQVNADTVEPFEGLLQARTGWSKENVPSETQITYPQIGKYLFRIVSTPYETIAYGGIVNSLVNEKLGKDGQPVKDTGELVLIREGFADEKLKEALQAVNRNGKWFVSAEKLRTRIDKLTKGNTNTSLRQPAPECYPLTL